VSVQFPETEREVGSERHIRSFTCPLFTP
jgi:hypothetical protein